MRLHSLRPGSGLGHPYNSSWCKGSVRLAPTHTWMWPLCSITTSSILLLNLNFVLFTQINRHPATSPPMTSICTIMRILRVGEKDKQSKANPDGVCARREGAMKRQCLGKQRWWGLGAIKNDSCCSAAPHLCCLSVCLSVRPSVHAAGSLGGEVLQGGERRVAWGGGHALHLGRGARGGAHAAEASVQQV